MKKFQKPEKRCTHKKWIFEYISCCNKRFRCLGCRKLTKADFAGGSYFCDGDFATIGKDGLARVVKKGRK